MGAVWRRKSEAFLSSGRRGTTTCAAIRHWCVEFSLFNYLFSYFAHLTEAVTLNLQFRHVDNIRRENVRLIVDSVLQRQLAHVDREDRVGVEINHVSLDKRVLVPFTSAEKHEDEACHCEEPKKIGKGQHEATTTKIVNRNDWYKKHCGRGGCFVQVPL